MWPRLFPLILLAAPVWAEDQPAPPGCTDVITIQGQSCTLRRVMSCPGLSEGYMIRAFGAEGLVATQYMDAGSMVTRFDSADGAETLMTQESDRYDIAGLLQMGSDSYDYVLTTDGTVSVRISGTVKDTGTIAEIDGRTLMVLHQFDTLSVEGTERQQETVMYYDRDLSLLITGRSTDPATGAQNLDRTPVTFLLPGETGALTVTPMEGCAS
jgi:hypothetical protein